VPKNKRSAGPTPDPQPFVPAYRPSWVDRVLAWIDGWPGPAWVAYAGLALLSLVVLVAVQARAGAYAGGFVPWHIFLAIQPILPLAAIRYLNGVAERALEIFRPSLDPAHYAEARYRLLTMPAVPSAIASLASITLMILWIVQGPSNLGEMWLAPSTFPFFVVFSLLMGLSYGPLIYFAIHQAREVGRLHARIGEVDLYHAEPLYAFSRLTARIAVVLIFINYGWSFDDPTTFQDPLSLITSLVSLVVALTVFAAPLWGVHRILAREKEHALAENGSRFKAAAAQLHRRIDTGRVSGMDDLNKAMASLDLERSHLARTSTWPWQPETLRGLLAAVALPIVVWLIQFGLQRWLG
jgi:hypothetical protein